jgi:hypothetical protein
VGSRRLMRSTATCSIATSPALSGRWGAGLDENLHGFTSAPGTCGIFSRGIPSMLFGEQVLVAALNER